MGVVGAVAVLALGIWVPRRAVTPADRPLARLTVDLGPEASLPAFASGGVSGRVAISPDGTRSRSAHELTYRSGDQIMAASYTVSGDMFVP